MKIIVVDDHIAAQETVTVALASDPATKYHVVTGVRTPDELHRIDDLGTFGLASAGRWLQDLSWAEI
jgi:hypothetical protein